MVDDGWKPYYRIAHREHKLEARRARGGEPIGHEGLGRTAKAGVWLCRNPDNGYCWTIDDDSFEEFYCEEGKAPPLPPPKTQAAGHRKKGRKKPKLIDVDGEQVFDFDPVVDDLDEEDSDAEGSEEAEEESGEPDEPAHAG